jgi:hypothetical protein
LLAINKLRAAQFAGRPLIENLKRRVESADAVKPSSQGDLGHGHSRFDNQLFREEDPARLSNSDRRGSKILPEEAPKLTLTEGLETVLSVRTAVPAMPMAAALSSSHLAVFRPPYTLRRLYIAQDNDPAGQLATQKLSRSAMCIGIKPVVLTPTLDDFNSDLRKFGVGALQTALREQLRPEDVSRFMASEAGKAGGDAVPLQPDPGGGPPEGEPRPRACEGAI